MKQSDNDQIFSINWIKETIWILKNQQSFLEIVPKFRF